MTIYIEVLDLITLIFFCSSLLESSEDFKLFSYAVSRHCTHASTIFDILFQLV